VLRARDFTERQIDVVRSWLAEPHLSRAELGSKLGIGEATVRAHLNVARRKLGCDGRRGADALRDRIAALAGTYRLN
jgi:DNA-binding CsgD family transcriptional regulator